MEGAKECTVDEGMLPFLLTLLPARGAVTLLVQVVVDLMMDDCLLNAVHRPFGFG